MSTTLLPSFIPPIGTENGEVEYLESLDDTLFVLSDPNAIVMFEKSKEDVKEGRLIDHEKVKEELLTSCYLG